MEDKKENICELCEKLPSKYCCPRCNLLYCSLDCYKSEKHQNCSESFYRDCVSEELANHHVDEESRNKMIEILKRMQTENINDSEQIEQLLKSIDHQLVDSDDEEELDLHDRVKDLNLDDPDAVWEVLTEDEKNEFTALLNEGDVGAIMSSWKPWWMDVNKSNIIEDVSEKTTNLEKIASAHCPEIIEVPEFNSLTTVVPSPAIRCNIVNIIASYAFLMRYFNGEIEPLETTLHILSICANLDSNANFNDLSTAVESVAQKCLQCEFIQTDKESLDVMKHDTFLILQGPSRDSKNHYCKSALSHIYSIFKEAKAANKVPNSEKRKEKKAFSRKFPEHGRSHLPNLDIGKVKKCMKKIEFLLSYVNSYGMEFD